MKAIIQFDFTDGIYGDNHNEEISSLDYRSVGNVIDGIVTEAYNTMIDIAHDDLGINDFDIIDITDDNTNTFSYVISTGFPYEKASQALKTLDTEIRKYMMPFKTYLDDYGVQRIGWKEYSDGEDVVCPHLYKTVSFLAVNTEVREIQTCIHCKGSIAKLVPLV